MNSLHVMFLIVAVIGFALGWVFALITAHRYLKKLEQRNRGVW
jgi:hypothetical protein